VSLHLVGHSAGAIFAAAMLDRLAEAGLQVDSVALMAPAIRVDRFRQAMLPRLGAGNLVARFATFGLTGAAELQDVCGSGVGSTYVEVYHKSLLYLVSRAFERAAPGECGEVPILGMEKFLDAPPANGETKTLNQTIVDAGGLCIFSPTDASAALPSQSTSHGGFHDDPATMTSLVLHALAVGSLPNGRTYQPNAALDPVVCAPALNGFGLASPVQPASGDQPAAVVVETSPPGATPVEVLAEPQTDHPVAPADAGSPGVEKAVALRSGKPIVDALERQGWKRVIP
ncbi:MAG TPA: hypothetical protein VKT80_02150, partial [Chloroflexota bacterium]|nr:hypothetical protein [Chloroflexota bacterium]